MDFYTLFNLNKKVVNLGGYLKSLKYLFFNRNYYSAVKRNINILDKKKSDICYICALGPSLRSVDLSKINGDTIVVNDFFRIGKNNPGFVPTFYLMIDALYKSEEYIKSFEDAINQYSEKNTVFLLHPVLADILEKSHSQSHFFYLSCFKGLFNAKKEFKIDKVMPAFGNVACTAIACALALGYKKIVLLGCDFSSFASRKMSHCYEENSQRSLRMSYELYCYSFVADMHDQLQAYAMKHGVEIINSTRGSLIDAYPYEIDETLYKS